ncbi:hypothetical protein P154DRAFT_593083 [Amniculicola lignicola CBS 123094]|uniref:Mid2 domain-containing protein n=1 Tax=Amniculicola lignicola CBS 123094 TaxID=1392246 RepID=A0A6A5X3S9_9PLEO|nr:hypothetical protein P154DRAFT_593083 [Amniculicola lignicola CBS 123094]
MEHILTLILLVLCTAPTTVLSTATLQLRILSNPHFNETLSAPGRLQRVQKRQITSVVSTCGYYNGNIKSSRTADSGFGCRVDTSNGLWGLCPTTVITATDCGLAGYCFDEHSCRNGCGRLSSRQEITTLTCGKKGFCSTALLINGPDQSFEYIACGAANTVQSLLAVPNAIEASTTPTSVASSSTPFAISSLTTASSYTSTTSTDVPTPPTRLSTAAVIALSTSASNVTPAGPTALNVGAIVGGTIAGLVVICGTILGLFIIRRNRQSSPAVYVPTHNQEEYTGTVGFGGYNNSEVSGKPLGWDSSYGPVEMNVNANGEVSPVELPGNNIINEPRSEVLGAKQ